MYLDERANKNESILNCNVYQNIQLLSVTFTYCFLRNDFERWHRQKDVISTKHLSTVTTSGEHSKFVRFWKDAMNVNSMSVCLWQIDNFEDIKGRKYVCGRQLNCFTHFVWFQTHANLSNFWNSWQHPLVLFTCRW